MTRFYAAAIGLAVIALAAPASGQTPLSTAAEKEAFEAANPAPVAAPLARTASTEDLLIPLDGGFSVVVFDGPGGNGDANPSDPLQRNDDDVTNAIALPFAFDFYGTTYTSVHINNNGNLTFEGPLTTFTPFAFPSGTPIVAPFFADVDTRNPASGVVHVKSESNRFTVTWDGVGYFGNQADKLNTFQVILSDGTDPLMGIGNNVCLSYGDMNWTTGSASGGSNGFGGTPANAGTNAGDGASFFTVGRFDKPGDDYDGPAGDSDGIDYLDDRDVCFSTGESVTNIPPIPQDIADGDVFPVVVGAGQVAIDFSFISPEDGQTTTITSPDFDNSGFPTGNLCSFEGDASFSTTPGNPATGQILASVAAGSSPTAGEYDVRLEACDDGPDGGECTEITVTIDVQLSETVTCGPDADFYILDFGTDVFRIYSFEFGPLDFNGCSFVALDAFTEQVVLSVPLTYTLAPFMEPEVNLPPNSIPAGPGAVAVVQGAPAVGTDVLDLLGTVAHAVVYFDNETFYGGCGQLSSLVVPIEPCGTAEGDAAFAAALAQLGQAVAAEDDPEAGFALSVAPNPVGAAATVTFTLAEAVDVRVAVYDALGREVAVAAEGAYGVGRHTAPLDASALPAGVYVVRATAGAEALATPFTIVR